MDYGAHLPMIDFEGTEFSLEYLLRFTERAEGLGFSGVAANDHIVFPQPWLDGTNRACQCSYEDRRNDPSYDRFVADRARPDGTCQIADGIGFTLGRPHGGRGRTWIIVPRLRGGRYSVRGTLATIRR